MGANIPPSEEDQTTPAHSKQSYADRQTVCCRTEVINQRRLVGSEVERLSVAGRLLNWFCGASDDIPAQDSAASRTKAKI